jgi:hypothetical protein
MNKHTARHHKKYSKRRVHSKRHGHSKRRVHSKRHGHSKRRIYRKRRELVIIPGSKSVPIFTAPQKKDSHKIIVNDQNQSGNIIPGLRDYIKNM